MTATFTTARELANFSGDQSADQSRPVGRAVEAVMRAARALWARKLPAELAAITGASQRHVERWLSGDRGISADHLAALIRSEHGREFLVALMADANPEWWRDTQEAMRLGWVRRQHKKLEEVLRAHDSIGATIARAEAAIRVSDQEFRRPQSDAVCGPPRVANRAVASARRGR